MLQGGEERGQAQPDGVVAYAAEKSESVLSIWLHSHALPLQCHRRLCMPDGSHPCMPSYTSEQKPLVTGDRGGRRASEGDALAMHGRPCLIT